MTIDKKCALALALCFFAFQTSAQQPYQMLDAKLLPGWRTDDGTHLAGLHLELGTGWKTYWRSPGETGIPPIFDWTESSNISSIEVEWPSPMIFTQAGARSIGYSGQVTLPLRVTPENIGQPVRIVGNIDLGVCSDDLCVPVPLSVSGYLPSTSFDIDPHISAALASLPLSGNEASVKDVSCRVQPVDDELQLDVEIALPRSYGREIAVVETGNPAILVESRHNMVKGNSLRTQVRLYHMEGRAFGLDRSRLRITVLGGPHAVEIIGCSAS